MCAGAYIRSINRHHGGQCCNLEPQFHDMRVPAHAAGISYPTPRPALRAVPVPSLDSLRRRVVLPRGAARHALLWGTVVLVALGLTVLLGALGYAGTAPSTGLRLVTNLGVFACYALLGYLVCRPLLHRPPPPARALWLPIVAAAFGFVAAAGIIAVTGGAAPTNAQTGLPYNLSGAFQVVGIATIEVVIAVVLLCSLRALVLFKRSSASARNWRLMVGFMIAAALVLLTADPVDEVNRFVPHIVLLVATVVLMVANAFRLAWIVYLSFRQKLIAIALVVTLGTLLVMLLAYRSSGGWMGTYVLAGGTGTGHEIEIALSAVLSQPLSQFVTITLAFGVLYCATALLALLFHLPTAGALQQKTGEMEALQALARLSSEVFDRDKLINTIAVAPVEAGVAQAAWLALIDPRSGSLRPKLAAVHGLTPIQVKALTDTEALAADVCQRRKSLVLAQAPADHRVRARPGDGIGSLVVLPLRAHEADLGALFATRAIADGFEADDVAALETFAAQAALALTNADLVAERLERERLARELAIAREVQQQLLPQHLPCSGLLACAALSLPAEEVAGDYYDVVELGDDRYGVIVADVAGKGTRAAFYMAELKGIFQSVGRLTDSPKEVLVRANEALAGSLHRAAFISAIYAVVDARAGEVTVARAGHCPAILARADGRVELIRPAGLGLGLDRGPLFRRALEEERVEVGPGDTLLLYTDGLVESRSASGEEYGYERLATAVGRYRELGAEPLSDALLDELRRFAGRRTGPDMWEDDLTLVVLHWITHADAPILLKTRPSASTVPSA
jgi:phosphoserine phosphatase RsbU/P